MSELPYSRRLALKQLSRNSLVAGATAAYVASTGARGLAQTAGPADVRKLPMTRTGTPNLQMRPEDAKRTGQFSVRDYGAKGDGVSADQAAFLATQVAAGDAPLWISPGKYLITANLTLKNSLVFAPGAVLVISAGVQIELDGAIEAGHTQIFEIRSRLDAVRFGSGTRELSQGRASVMGTTPSRGEFTERYPRRSVASGASHANVAPAATPPPQDVTYAEWFGAQGNGTTDDASAINAAIASLPNTGGYLQLLAKVYLVGSTIVVTRAKIGVHGEGPDVSVLLANFPAADVLRFSGSSNNKITSNVVRDLSIERADDVGPTNGAGLSVSFVQAMKITDVTARTHFIGFYFYGTNNVETVRCHSLRELATGASQFYGFYIDGGDHNLSIGFDHCLAVADNFTGTSYGFYLTGALINDTFFDACEADAVSYGLYVDGTGSKGNYNFDIHLSRFISDPFYIAGIYVKNLSQYGMLEVNGGWTDSGNSSSQANIVLESCRGISITGHHFFNFANTPGTQFKSGSSAFGTGLQVNGSLNCTVTGCIFKELLYGVSARASGLLAINGNTFYNDSTTNGNTAIALSAFRCAVAANVVDGSWSYGIAILPPVSGGLSGHANVVGNAINPASMRTASVYDSTHDNYIVGV